MKFHHNGGITNCQEKDLCRIAALDPKIFSSRFRVVVARRLVAVSVFVSDHSACLAERRWTLLPLSSGIALSKVPDFCQNFTDFWLLSFSTKSEKILGFQVLLGRNVHDFHRCSRPECTSRRKRIKECTDRQPWTRNVRARPFSKFYRKANKTTCMAIEQTLPY